jgi:DNA repair exonuclease SbcCD ATPase subunit
VTLEQALHNNESGAGLMICPKCGHEQEERLDCLKCGVVFSKYYALFPSSKSSGVKNSDDSIAHQQSDQERRAVISDLQLQIREISTRIAEVEFEKAERNQLRIELKNLEQLLQTSLDQLANRLEQCEKRFGELLISTTQQEMENHFPSLLRRLEQVEGGFGRLEHIDNQINDLNEKGEARLLQLSELEVKYSTLIEEFAAIRGRLEQIYEAQKNEEPRTPLEEDVHAIRRNLEEFRQILSKGFPF